MKKLVLVSGAFALMVWSAANAADGQELAKAKAACQANPTQCSQAKADARKEVQAAKNACAKNQSKCDSAKSKAKSALSQ